MEELTKQFNSITGEAKHALASNLLQSNRLEEREERLLNNIMKIYGFIDNIAVNTKLAIAATACQSDHIPSQIVTPSILKSDLTKIQRNLPMGWELAVPMKSLGQYFALPIASCMFSNQQVAVMIRVPIIRTNMYPKLYSVKPIHYRDYNRTCSKSLPSAKLLSVNRGKEFHWILNDEHCQPERDSMCHVGRDVIADATVDSQCRDCETICVNSSRVRVVSKGGDIFAISNPPSNIQFKCGNNISVVEIPKVQQGHLEVTVPCNCEATIGDRKVEGSFPCETNGARSVALAHIIPSHWIPENETNNIAALLSNETMDYATKLSSLLNASWEITQKPLWISPEVVTPPMTAYERIKSTAMGFHLEWSVVITILIFIIILRKPINLLLVRIIESGKTDREERLEQIIQTHDLNIKRLQARLSSPYPLTDG
ncbi:hypothetical protein M8J77_020517 [Diaphorina citri]|nr:hypothetical protein M8J77_010817 [Diaphorina citri]KAI5708319.1 hypothetical protein M8J77_020517 [Diaphorina citri]